MKVRDDPPKDGGGLTSLRKCEKNEGPVLNCRDSTKHRALYLNELVVHEIRNNAPAIFKKIVSSCCKIEFVQCGKNTLRSPSVSRKRARK
jgi:hypothetical protein